MYLPVNKLDLTHDSISLYLLLCQYTYACYHVIVYVYYLKSILFKLNKLVFSAKLVKFHLKS